MTEPISFHTLALATPSLADDQLSEPFAVLYTGEFRHGGREIPVSLADLDNAVKVFDAQKAAGYEPSIDWEHSFASGGTSKAAGWIKELWREGKKLMARVKWTPQAREEIANETFRYLSPEFSSELADESGKGLGFGLLAAGLTNRPHLRALGAVALSEEVNAAVGADALATDHLSAMREALREELEALDLAPGEVENAGRKTAHMADENTVTLTEDQHKTLVESASQVEALTEKVEALSEAITASNDAREKVEQELRAERLTACLSQARREGRIDASDETTEKWTERADKLGLDTVKELLSEMPAETIPMSERGHGQDKPETATAPEGVRPEYFAAHERALQIAKDRDISYEQAASIAFQEVVG